MRHDFLSMAFISALLLLVLDASTLHVKTVELSDNQIIKTKIQKIKREYGIAIDSFEVSKKLIRPNQYLSELLTGVGVAYGLVDKIVKKSRGVFDFRKIRKGKPYTIFYSKDSLQKPQYWVYEKTDTEYVVIDLSDSLRVFTGKKAVTKKTKTVSGTITSSLWNAMTDNGIDPLLANKLSSIYAWTIDFFALQKGDHFKLVYDELFVDSVCIGFGEVHASYFVHQNTNFYAFWFEKDTVKGYYNEKAESLQKAFLKAPLKFSRISSGFSYRRLHPVHKVYRAHLGVDYAAPYGTPVYSIGDGVVQKAHYSGGAGNMVKIKHNAVYSTAYLHLSKYAKGVRAGTRVSQGQLIGYVGSTGTSTGPHLDFRVWQNGKNVNPVNFSAPPAPPLDSAYRHAYWAVKDSLLKQLRAKENKQLAALGTALSERPFVEMP